MKIGDKILLKNCSDLPDYNGRTGTVLYIDDFGFMKGTWGKELINEEIDEVEKIGYEHLSEKTIRLAEMSSNQADAVKKLKGGLEEGIIHLIKLFSYKDAALYMEENKDGWIGTVHRNISCRVRKETKSYLTKQMADKILSDELTDEKFKIRFESVRNECKSYKVKIDPKSINKAKEFVSKYLNWVFPLLIKTPVIDKQTITNKIEELYKEFE